MRGPAHLPGANMRGPDLRGAHMRAERDVRGTGHLSCRHLRWARRALRTADVPHDLRWPDLRWRHMRATDLRSHVRPKRHVRRWPHVPVGHLPAERHVRRGAHLCPGNVPTKPHLCGRRHVRGQPDVRGSGDLWDAGHVSGGEHVRAAADVRGRNVPPKQYLRPSGDLPWHDLWRRSHVRLPVCDASSPV